MKERSLFVRVARAFCRRPLITVVRMEGVGTSKMWRPRLSGRMPDTASRMLALPFFAAMTTCLASPTSAVTLQSSTLVATRNAKTLRNDLCTLFRTTKSRCHIGGRASHHAGEKSGHPGSEVGPGASCRTTPGFSLDRLARPRSGCACRGSVWPPVW